MNIDDWLYKMSNQNNSQDETIQCIDYINALIKMVYNEGIADIVKISIIKHIIATLVPVFILTLPLIDKLIQISYVGYILMTLSAICLYISNLANEKKNQTRELKKEIANMKQRLSRHDEELGDHGSVLVDHDSKLVDHDSKFVDHDSKFVNCENNIKNIYHCLEDPMEQLRDSLIEDMRASMKE